MSSANRMRAWLGLASALGGLIALGAVAAAVVWGGVGRRGNGAPIGVEAGSAAEGADDRLGYRAGVERAGVLAARIDERARTGDLAAVDDAADQLRRIAEGMGRTALGDRTVPRSEVKRVNLAGKGVANAAVLVHDAAAAGDLDRVRAGVAGLQTAFAALVAAAPDRYVCPSHCEGAKSYPSSGRCPVCSADLVLVGRAPWCVRLRAEGTVEAGSPFDLRMDLLDPAGEPAGALETVHEHPLHVVIVSEDLSSYTHAHPERQRDGSFLLRGVTLPFAGRFVVYADCTPEGTGNQVARAELQVLPGDAAPHSRMELVEDFDGVGRAGAYEFRVRCNGAMFYAGEDSFLRYGIDLGGEPVKDLEPLMGAAGHLVIVSADFKHFVHAHPMELGDLAQSIPEPGHHHDERLTQKARAVLYGNGNRWDVVFHAVLPEPGMYRAFAQFQHRGKILTYAVTIDARPARPGEAAASGEHQHRRGP